LYAERHGAGWPVLIAGLADKAKASAELPVLDRVRAFARASDLGACIESAGEAPAGFRMTQAEAATSTPSQRRAWCLLAGISGLLGVLTTRLSRVVDRLLQLRRDLDALEEQGRARRTHGGVLYSGGMPRLAEFDERQPANWAAKRAIAVAAAAVISDGETVLLDGGTTTYEVARLLVRRLHDLELPNVTALEGPDAPAIAATLAEGAGGLSLPFLERITPRALSALLRKADVEIPDVASLNLVPDPGGGADDFVDPRP
jgi:hypothetical protein